jgi:hypothetical protein
MHSVAGAIWIKNNISIFGGAIIKVVLSVHFVYKLFNHIKAQKQGTLKRDNLKGCFPIFVLS